MQLWTLVDCLSKAILPKSVQSNAPSIIFVYSIFDDDCSHLEIPPSFTYPFAEGPWKLPFQLISYFTSQYHYSLGELEIVVITLCSTDVNGQNTHLASFITLWNAVRMATISMCISQFKDNFEHHSWTKKNQVCMISQAQMQKIQITRLSSAITHPCCLRFLQELSKFLSVWVI